MFDSTVGAVNRAAMFLGRSGARLRSRVRRRGRGLRRSYPLKQAPSQ
ncbi:hypothetical protein LA76x_4849 [Lysobacter antibioticus]|uniref:Uncharacterized protein n=1 Tax=Lysobacter antibioticus TaxID=84531 RepID=A0A0S2FHD1_LYSAN|nr:hypothetical protein LA76x_4849 [Lysobacter antibioticus]